MNSGKFFRWHYSYYGGILAYCKHISFSKIMCFFTVTARETLCFSRGNTLLLPQKQSVTKKVTIV